VPESLAALLAVVALVVSLIAIVVALRVARSMPAQVERPALARRSSSADQEADLADVHDRIGALAGSSRELAERLDELEVGGQKAMKLVGLVRFNPFDDTGSNQSFALALLDSEVNGFVLSSLHSRQATRVYLKEIVGGRSEAPLSEEETEALRRAGAYDRRAV